MALSRARRFQEFCREFETDPAVDAELAKRIGVSVRTIERYRARYRRVTAGEETLERSSDRAVLFLIWLAKLERPAARAEIVRFFAEQCGVGERTAERTMATLRAQGLLEKTPKGCSLGRGIMPRLNLTPAELEQLAAFIDGHGSKGPFARALESALVKLRLGVSGAAETRLLAKAGKRQTRILIKGPGSDRCGPAAVMDSLVAAAEDGRFVEIEYQSPQVPERLRLTVLPAGLVYNWMLDAWYLVAENAGTSDVELYRLDRLLSCLPRQGVASGSGAKIPAYLIQSWGTENGPAISVRVRFRPDFGVHDKVRRDAAARPSAILTEEPGGGLLFTDTVRGLGEFSRWLRQYGASAEVLDPPELLELLRAGARRKLERYGIPCGGNGNG